MLDTPSWNKGPDPAFFWLPSQWGRAVLVGQTPSESLGVHFLVGIPLGSPPPPPPLHSPSSACPLQPQKQQWGIKSSHRPTRLFFVILALQGGLWPVRGKGASHWEALCKDTKKEPEPGQESAGSP